MRYDWAGEEERARDLQDRLEILERAVRDYQRLCYAMKEYAQPGAPTLDDPAKFMEWLLQQAEARGFDRAWKQVQQAEKYADRLENTCSELRRIIAFLEENR